MGSISSNDVNSLDDMDCHPQFIALVQKKISELSESASENEVPSVAKCIEAVACLALLISGE